METVWRLSAKTPRKRITRSAFCHVVSVAAVPLRAPSSGTQMHFPPFFDHPFGFVQTEIKVSSPSYEYG